MSKAKIKLLITLATIFFTCPSSAYIKNNLGLNFSTHTPTNIISLDENFSMVKQEKQPTTSLSEKTDLHLNASMNFNNSLIFGCELNSKINQIDSFSNYTSMFYVASSIRLYENLHITPKTGFYPTDNKVFLLGLTSDFYLDSNLLLELGFDLTKINPLGKNLYEKGQNVIYDPNNIVITSKLTKLLPEDGGVHSFSIGSYAQKSFLSNSLQEQLANKSIFSGITIGVVLNLTF